MAMPSVIPQTPGVGEKLGEAFGTGLGSGLQALANMKLQQIQQRQQAMQTEQALSGLPGISKEQARAISQMPPHLQDIYTKDILAAPREQELSRMIQGLAGNPPPIDQIAQQQFQPTTRPATELVGAYTPAEAFPESARIAAPQQPQVTPQAMQPQQGQTPQIPGRMTPQAAMQMLSLMQGQKGLALKERALEQKYGAVETKELRRSYEQQQQYIDKAETNAKLRQEHKASLKKLITLVSSGEAILGKPRQLLEKLGWEKFFTNPTTENVQILINQLTGNTIRNIGVSRMTNKLATIEQGINASMWNSKEGIVAAAKNQLLNDYAEDKYDDARREVYDEYAKTGKKLPTNYESIVNKRAQPAVDKIYQQELDNYMDLVGTKLPKPAEWKKQGGTNGDIVELEEAPGVQWEFRDNKWRLYLAEGE